MLEQIQLYERVVCTEKRLASVRVDIEDQLELDTYTIAAVGVCVAKAKVTAGREFTVTPRV